MAPPPRTRVICADEMGPLAVKTYLGEEWKTGQNRAIFEPDYGRRGKLWVHGGFEPASGQAVILTSPGCDRASHVQLLEKIMLTFLAERGLIIEDNLSIHINRSTKLALAALAIANTLHSAWAHLHNEWAMREGLCNNEDSLIFSESFCLHEANRRRRGRN